MIAAAATEKMIGFYAGNRHDVAHFLKVWALARTIGELEGLDARTQEVLELAAVVHDIACPLCREKYGNTDGKNQERESAALVEAFFADLPVDAATVARIAWLAAHHHTYTDVDGADHRQDARAGVSHKERNAAAGCHLSAGGGGRSGRIEAGKRPGTGRAGALERVRDRGRRPCCRGRRRSSG